MKRGTFIEGMIVSLVFVIAVTAYFIQFSHSVRGITPPSAKCTLRELSSKLAPPRHLAVVTDKGQKRIVWIGAEGAFLSSGPPVYVFDVNGRLVDWSSDTGEAGPLDPIAAAAWRETELSLTEAITFCERASSVEEPE